MFWLPVKKHENKFILEIKKIYIKIVTQNIINEIERNQRKLKKNCKVTKNC